jgi:hypothetical protein
MQDGLYLLAFGIFGNMTQETGRSIKYRKAAKAGAGRGNQVHALGRLMRIGAIRHP